MAEIQLNNISKKWGAFVGVDNLNLSIKDKEFLVLLGPSGCGKTTTMRMIAGLEDVTEGDIYIDGKRVNDLDPKDRDVAMVFQSYALYPNMNVYENIRFPLKVRGVDPKTHDKKVRKAGKMVELEQFMHRKPAELSGGQRQRVALARAIVREPNVFLMDEPLSNLDAKLRVSTRAQIKNLSHELAVTTIYVTHDQVEAMTLADRVVVMKQGVVQQVASPEEIYEKPANIFVAGFIGSPAMNLIKGEIKNKIFKAKNTHVKNLKSINGKVTLGFRAEDASITKNNKSKSDGIIAPIYAIEMLGDATMISVKIQGTLVCVKADKKFKADIGDTIKIKINKTHCHLFNNKTGERIE